MHRSALYVPGDHDRAMAKAASLDADILIFDLEDGVAPVQKPKAREAIGSHFSHSPLEGESNSRQANSEGGNADLPHPPTPSLMGRGSLKCIRINHRDTPYYADDLAALSSLNLDGIMLSKVGGPDEIDHALSQLAQHHRGDLPIWCNVETPLGVTNCEAIAAHPAVRGLVAGTNDLANDLRIRLTPDRAGLLHSLQRLLLAGRAHGCIMLDGTFVDLADEVGLRAEAEQGRTLGFDGKTLIHPKQVAIANEVFGITKEERGEAKAIIEAYEAAMAENKAVALLNGRMIEALHYERAKATLSTT